MEKLEGTILELMREDGKSEEEVFEMVNKILIKTRKKAIRKNFKEKMTIILADGQKYGLKYW